MLADTMYYVAVKKQPKFHDIMHRSFNPFLFLVRIIDNVWLIITYFLVANPSVTTNNRVDIYCLT